MRYKYFNYFVAFLIFAFIIALVVSFTRQDLRLSPSEDSPMVGEGHKCSCPFPDKAKIKYTVTQDCPTNLPPVSECIQHECKIAVKADQLDNLRLLYLAWYLSPTISYSCGFLGLDTCFEKTFSCSN